MLTILTYALFTGLSFFAQSWWQLMIFRFLAALGIGGEWAVGASLLLIDGIAIHFSMGTFGIRIDERVVAIGLGAGLFVGVAGCVIPAIRCLRLPLPSALKSD